MWIMGVSMAMSFVSILKATCSATTTTTVTDHRSYSSSSRLIDENDPAVADSGVYSNGSHRLSSTGNSEHHTHSLVSSTSNPLPEYNPQESIHPSNSILSQVGFHSIRTSTAHTTTTTTTNTNQTLPYTLLGINSDVWLKVFRRTLLLFLIGMFLANGHKYQTWRVPGVLQYFAVSYLITGITVLSVHTLTKKRLEYLIIDTTTTSTNAKESQKSEHPNNDDEDHSSSSSTNNRETNWFFNRPQDQEGNSTVWQKWEGYCLSAKGLVLNHGNILPMTSRHWMYALWKKWNVLTAYCYEWIIQLSLLILYLSIVYGVKAPNCPVGYVGPGGISDNSRYEGCTGGIHRYIDMKVFSYTHIYHHPTCLEMYQCQAYDPEGLLGSISACTLTYLGLMAGRVVVHFKDHNDRLIAWFIGGLVILLLSGDMMMMMMMMMNSRFVCLLWRRK